MIQRILISEDEAQLGEVDEIEFVDTDDGGYYNVDIDNG